MFRLSLLPWALLTIGTTAIAKDLKLSSNHLYERITTEKVFAASHNDGALQYGWYPQYTTRDTGKWNWEPISNSSGWTAGFFPSMLYLMGEREKLCPGLAPNVDWTFLGRAWSTPLLQLQSKNAIQSSIGMAAFPFIDELKVNPNNATARAAIIEFANELASRFHVKVGALIGRDPTGDGKTVTVAIDDMTNLMGMMAAYELTKNETLRVIAIAHADRTIKDILRDNGTNGTYHLVDYDSSTGAVISRKPAVHYTWSRGAAWAMLGFTELYAATKFDLYRQTAGSLASYFVNNLPKGKDNKNIVPWNLNSGQDTPSDSSAAMIAAYALARLSEVETNTALAVSWKGWSAEVLNPNGYMAWKPQWESILGNGTVNNAANPPNNETGIIYGDYFFLKLGNHILERKWLKCE